MDLRRVEHDFNTSSTLEAGAGGSLSLRIAVSTE